MNIRKASANDINSVVHIHLGRFSSFFLTSLGDSFLKAFYRAFLKSPGILLVLEDENVIKGFAAGNSSNSSFFKKLLMNNFFEFSIEGMRILLTKPTALKRLAINAGKSEKIKFTFAELLSIATEKNTKGYGKLLLQAFENEISTVNNELTPISLTTDFDDNEKAVKFYLDSGYQIEQVFESYNGRKMYRFIKYK